MVQEKARCNPLSCSPQCQILLRVMHLKTHRTQPWDLRNRGHFWKTNFGREKGRSDYIYRKWSVSYRATRIRSQGNKNWTKKGDDLALHVTSKFSSFSSTRIKWRIFFVAFWEYWWYHWCNLWERLFQSSSKELVESYRRHLKPAIYFLLLLL